MSDTEKIEFDAGRAEEILRWIAGIVGEEINTSGNVENFLAVLQDGSMLCRLANELEPGAVKKFNTSSLAFKKMENISFFLAFAGRYVSPMELFQTVDLYEAQDPNAVLICLSALARKAEQAFGRPGVGLREEQTREVRRRRLPYDILYTIFEKWLLSKSKFYDLLMLNQESSAIFGRVFAPKVLVTIFVNEGVIGYFHLRFHNPSNNQELEHQIPLAMYLHLSNGPLYKILNTVLDIAFSVKSQQDKVGELDILPRQAYLNAKSVHFHYNFEADPTSFTFNFGLFRTERWRHLLLYMLNRCIYLDEISIELGNIVMGTDQVLDFLASLQFLIGWLTDEVLPYVDINQTAMALYIQFAISNAIYRLRLSEGQTNLTCRVFAQPEIAIFFQLMTIIVSWSLEEILPRMRLPCIVKITFTNLPVQHNFVEMLEDFRQTTGLMTSEKLTTAGNMLTTTMDNGNTDHYFAIHWEFPIL